MLDDDDIHYLLPSQALLYQVVPSLFLYVFIYYIYFYQLMPMVIPL